MSDKQRVEEVDNTRTTSCGLFSYRPPWLQRFATPHCYIALYSTIGILLGVTFAYLTVVLSTIEKRFGLQSKESAWLYAGNEISQIFFIFILPFAGRIKRRPLWLGIALVISGLGSLLIVVPHFLSHGDDGLADQDGQVGINTEQEDLCQLDGEAKIDRCSNGSGGKDFVGLILVFLGIFLNGIGISFYYSFGLPYVDDNSEKSKSPLRLAWVLSARMVGPTLGSILGAIVLKSYTDPANPPDYDDTDPRWIGAWWIGFLVIGIPLVLFGPLFCLFPERLPIKNTDAEKLERKQSLDKPETAKEWLRELLTVTRRLLTNRVWMFNLGSTVFFLFGLIGFFTFLPKYFEFHFRQTASNVGAAGGLTKAGAAVLGIFVSGCLIRKYKFRAKSMAFFCALTTFVSALCYFFVGFISCPTLVIQGYNSGMLQAQQQQPQPYSQCNNGCHCEEQDYHPICSRDGVTQYFSPCHAGCKLTNSTLNKKGQKLNLYWECGCVAQDSQGNADPWWIKAAEEEEDGSAQSPPPPAAAISTDGALPTIAGAVDGYCPSSCTGQFFAVLGLFFVMGLFQSAARVPNFLVMMRVIDVQDKAAGMTISVWALSLFAFLPGPIVIGSLIDSACLIWGDKCGDRTSCLVYDTDAMRYYMSGYACVAMVLAWLCDVGVWYYVPEDLDLYDDPEDRDSVDGGKGSMDKFNDSGIDTHEDFTEIELNDLKS